MAYKKGKGSGVDPSLGLGSSPANPQQTGDHTQTLHPESHPNEYSSSATSQRGGAADTFPAGTRKKG